MSENKSLNNVNKILKDPKQRSIVAILVLIGVIAIGVGFWSSSKTQTQKTSQEAAGAYVAKAPTMEVVPGSSSNLEYNKQVQTKNEKDGVKALEENKSFLPTLTNDSTFSNVSPIDQLDQQLKLEKQRQEEMKKKEEPVVVPEPTPVPPIPEPTPIPPQIIEPPPVVVMPSIKPVVQKAKLKYGPEDALLIATLSEVWKNKASASEYDYARANGANGGAGNATAQAASEGVANQTEASSSQANGMSAIPISKAGDIHIAVLETSVNSDEPSPILAKIISGPLKGTRLIGSINVTGEKVILAFSTASIPKHPKSVGIQAVAIDANTSRTALASNVDNHYFLRYGVLLGATFLGGFADALTNNNKTTIVQNGQVIQIPNGGMSAKEINQQALGSVGKELANQAKQATQGLKPTITVDSGTAMGVLILSDFVITNQ